MLDRIAVTCFNDRVTGNQGKRLKADRMSKNLKAAIEAAKKWNAKIFKVGFDSYIVAHCEVEGGKEVSL